ncbi:MAG TPA: cupin domain-containing protein [Stellaceae bacterium]|jgi:cupin 2 domain-containing protein|nr:cupin domain-containing protein [Stellaceae bacterium]
MNGFGNLYVEMQAPLGAERFDEILAAPGLRIERIVSTGQATPPGEWLDQAQAEWVILLRGGATLRFADEDRPRALRPGDYLNIPAHCRHRVEATAAGEPTIWLALHYAA